MKTETVRQKLHEYIDSASDKKVQAFLTLIEEEISEEYVSPLEDPAFVAEMDRRYNEYLADPSKAVSLDEVEKKARALAKSKTQ